jgi:hypothetical protein
MPRKKANDIEDDHGHPPVIDDKTFYTREQRLEMLKNIRDRSLDWWQDCIEAKTAKGMMVSRESFERAEASIENLKARGVGTTEDNRFEWADFKADEAEA